MDVKAIYDALVEAWMDGAKAFDVERHLEWGQEPQALREAGDFATKKILELTGILASGADSDD